MAIPFFEPRNSSNSSNDVEMLGDQVDGLGPSTSNSNNTPHGPTSGGVFTVPQPQQHQHHHHSHFATTIHDLADEVLAWKMLAVALCRTLKQYYKHSTGQPKQGNASGSGAGAFNNQPTAMQKLPNGKFKPIWK